MTDHANELRRLAQAATPGPWINHGRQPNFAGLPHSAVAAKTLLARVYSEAYGDVEQETANASFIAAANPASITELLDRLEAAESDAAHQKALAASALRVAEGWERKCGELRAKIEQMERQLLDRLEEAEKERDALRAKIEQMEKRLRLILEEPENTMSNSKALREMVRQARLALKESK